MTTYARKDVGNTSPLLVGVQTGIVALDISMVISQKIRKQSTSRPSNNTSGYIPKGCSILPQGHMFIAALFVVTRSWIQPNAP